MSTSEFVAQFRKASATATGIRAYLPGEMVDAWKHTVDGYLDGYDDPLDEYYYGLGIRGSLEAVLRDPEMQHFPELNWVREQVTEADQRFRTMLQDEPVPRLADLGLPWWESHPPRYAGPELAAEYLSRYGVHVEVREN